MELTFSEIITSLIFLASIVGVWVDARLRINTTELKIRELSQKLDEHCDVNTEENKAFIKELKEVATKQLETTESLREEINNLKIILARAQL